MVYHSYWWGDPPRNFSRRMSAEILAMRAQFNKGKKFILPGLKSIDDCDVEIEVLDLKLNMDDPQWIFWLVTFRMNNQSPYCQIESRDRWQIKIHHPRSYPNNEGGALVTVESHDVNDSPHKMYLAQHPDRWYICLEGHSGAGSGWDPGASTAATAALWSLQWIRTYLYWKRTDNWPTYV